MLRFFSSIRQNLMNENKTSKYFKYAAGEVLLIVIGVIIALQLNNWNEDRINKALEQNYVERIISDLNQDLGDIEVTTQDSFYKMMIGNHVLKQLGEEDYIQTLVNSNKEWESIFGSSVFNTFVLDAQESFNSSEKPKEPPFGICIRLLSGRRGIDIRNYTYNELIANGRFEVIGDARIRRLISDYYGQQADRSGVVRYIRYGEESFNEARSKYDLPMVSDISFEDFMETHEDMNHFVATVKNLIISHVQSHAAFHVVTRQEAVSLLSELEDYVETL